MRHGVGYQFVKKTTSKHLKTYGHFMVSGGIKALFAQIRLILEAKFGDDP